jgi:integrase/recombinase XerD
MKKRQSEGYKLLKYLKKTQVDELLSKVKKDNKRNYLIILTLWKTGMRNDELVNLKKKDIKDDEIIIRKGKGNKPRMIPLDSSLGDLLSFHCSNLTDDDLLFPLTTASIRNIVHKYEGNGYLKPHMFRHSFAVHLLLQGVNIRVLQKILGHSDLATTAVYLDLIGKDIKDEYNKVEW